MPHSSYQLISNDGTIYPIGPNGLKIGRLNINDIVIRDTTVSRKHASILFSGNRCWIRDENSMAGTYVNGNRISDQLEIQSGDTLQIGPAMFHLSATVVTAPLPKRSRRNIILVVSALTTVFLLIGIIGSRGPGSSTGYQRRFTPTPLTPTISSPTETSALFMVTTPVVTKPQPSSATPTTFLSASIHCDELDQLKDLHSCAVHYSGTTQDTLWLSFRPHRLYQTNDFNLSVLIEGQKDALFPDRKGLIPLGLFEPNSEKTITLRMYCVNTVSGCPLITIHIQLLANDGKLEITSAKGEFDIQNAAFVPKATATKRQPAGPTPTETPSDAFGPTPTP